MRVMSSWQFVEDHSCIEKAQSIIFLRVFYAGFDYSTKLPDITKKLTVYSKKGYSKKRVFYEILGSS